MHLECSLLWSPRVFCRQLCFKTNKQWPCLAIPAWSLWGASGSWLLLTESGQVRLRVTCPPLLAFLQLPVIQVTQGFILDATGISVPLRTER